MKLRSPLALTLALAACAPLAPEELEEAGLDQPLLAPAGDGVLAPDPSTPSYARPSSLDGLGAAAPAALDLTTGHRVQVPVTSAPRPTASRAGTTRTR